MPKFHEIYATTPMPFKIRCQNGETATCDGNRVTWDASGSLVSAVSAATYEWEIVTEPTVESVLRERGYRSSVDGYDFRVHPSENQNVALQFRCHEYKRPTTPTQAEAIADILDQYR
jgi:hypothetical protein